VTEPSSIDLSRFTTRGFDRGRPIWFFALWLLCKAAFFQSIIPWPPRRKAALLRLFGAKVGRGLYIRPGVNIHFPWKLTLGDNVWIGEGCTLLNLAPITMEDNSALAHEVYLAAAGHDIEDPDFGYQNAPITVCRGAWIATRSFVGPGVTVGEHAVVAANATVVRDVEPWSVVGGSPARSIGTRRLRTP
jgi:putative colanic acid biosynthesis acetyltransferase WcaF